MALLFSMVTALKALDVWRERDCLRWGDSTSMSATFLGLLCRRCRSPARNPTAHFVGPPQLATVRVPDIRPTLLVSRLSWTWFWQSTMNPTW